MMSKVKTLKINWVVSCSLNEDIKVSESLISRERTSSLFNNLNWSPEISVDRLIMDMKFHQLFFNKLNDKSISLNERSNYFSCNKNGFDLNVNYRVSIIQPRIMVIFLDAEVKGADKADVNDIISIQHIKNNNNDPLRIFLCSLVGLLRASDSDSLKFNYIPSLVFGCDFVNSNILNGLKKNIGFFSKVVTRHAQLSYAHNEEVLKKEKSAENDRHATLIDKQGFTHIIDAKEKNTGSIKKRIGLCSDLALFSLIFEEFSINSNVSRGDDEKHYFEYVLYQLKVLVDNPRAILFRSKESLIFFESVSDERGLSYISNSIGKKRLSDIMFYDLLYDGRLSSNRGRIILDGEKINYSLFYQKKIYYMKRFAKDNGDKLFYSFLAGLVIFSIRSLIS